MAKLKNEVLTYQCPETRVQVKRTFSLNVSTAGEFYAYIPESDPDLYAVGLTLGIPQADRWKSGKLKVTAESLEGLIEALKNVLSGLAVAERLDEYVIAYIVHTDATFAVNDAGDISQNAEPEGFYWPEDDRYSPSSPLSTAKGYALAIGAEVMLKQTVTHKGETKVEYFREIPEGNEAAARLNAWVNLDIPKPSVKSWQSGREVKEVPFTDEAADFFNDLIFDTVRLAKRVKDATAVETDVLKLIDDHANGRPLLLGGA